MSQTKPEASAAAHSIMRLYQPAAKLLDSSLWRFALALVMSFSGKKDAPFFSRSFFLGFHGDHKLEDLFKPG